MIVDRGVAGAGFVAAPSACTRSSHGLLRLETGFAGQNPDAEARFTAGAGFRSARLPAALRSALEPERPDDFRWSTTPLRLHPGGPEDRHAALLRIELPPPPGAPELAVGWRLVDPDGRVLRHSPPGTPAATPKPG